MTLQNVGILPNNNDYIFFNSNVVLANQPLRSLSSRLTTQLMIFRNPRGAERGWVNQGERPYNRFVLISKIAVVEISIPLLLIIGSIESLAHGLYYLTSGSSDLISSSFFTLQWNLCNFAYSNLFEVNVPTDESYARHMFDYLNIRERAMMVFLAVDFAFSLITGSSFPIDPQLNMFQIDPNTTFLRPIDRAHLFHLLSRRQDQQGNSELERFIERLLREILLRESERQLIFHEVLPPVFNEAQ